MAVAIARVNASLAREIERTMPSRPFHLRFWDGVSLPATDEALDGGARALRADGASVNRTGATSRPRDGAGVPDGDVPDGGVPNGDGASGRHVPIFDIRAPSALGHLLRSPDRLGLGRAYVEGSLEVDDIDSAFLVVDEWSPPPIDARDRAKLAGTMLLAAAPRGIPRTPPLELGLHGSKHTIERDAQAVRYHYDAGNEFFKLFLDESMTYSCAIFSKGATTLEQAQVAKLDLIAQKLELSRGQRVLDVGCGWGAFAIHAAKSYGVKVLGITLSGAQAALAKRRVADAGLEGQVEIRVTDYRQLADEPFDAIASIGMAEHVGASQIDRYASCLGRLLRDGGLLLNHAIAMTRADKAGKPDDRFTMRYVFPDGEPLPLARVQLAIERAGMLTNHVEGFVEDYAITLRHWAQRLDEHLPEAEALVGPERTRVWRLYLRAARHGFDVGHTAVYQIRARKRNWHAPSAAALERRRLAALRPGR